MRETNCTYSIISLSKNPPRYNYLRRTVFACAFFAFSIFSTSGTFAEHISFSADSMSGTIGDKSDATTLSGEAAVITESMEIYADEIKMSGKDFRYIEATGSVKGINNESELEFTCGKLKYDRETKIADLSDNVSLKDVKNNVEAKAQIIQYNQKTDVAVMQIGIELKQKDNVCNGVYALYRKKEQMLELSGNAQIKQGSDTFRAQEITLNLDSQEITLDGRVKGSIVDERKSESAEVSGDGASDTSASGNAENASGEGNSGSEKTGEEAKNNSEAKDSGTNAGSDGKAALETKSSDDKAEEDSKDGSEKDGDSKASDSKKKNKKK